jgi:phage-related protein
MTVYSVHYLRLASEYLESIPRRSRISIKADIEDMSLGKLSVPHTKQLRGPIHELISGHHRLIYFILGQAIYIIRGFRKKSNRTPRDEIRYAQKVYKLMKREYEKG